MSPYSWKTATVNVLGIQSFQTTWYTYDLRLSSSNSAAHPMDDQSMGCKEATGLETKERNHVRNI